jgi:surface protein
MLNKYIIIPAIFIAVIMLATSCTDSTGPDFEDSLELYAGLETIPEASNSVVTINQGSDERTDGYFTISVDKVKANPFIKPGQHEAWCLEWNKNLRSSGDIHADVKWFNSGSNDKWKPLNYFFSIRKQLQEDDPSLTYRDIQAVVWVLAGEMGIAPKFDVMSLPVNQLPNRLVSNGKVNFSREKVAEIASSVMQQAPDAQVPFAGTVAQTAEGEQDIYVPANDLLNSFITTWDTSLGPNATVTLALAGTVDATIYWGDGSTSDVTTAGPHTHDYGSDGIYTVSVFGDVSAYNSDTHSTPEETQKLLTVESWGDLGFEDFSYAFYEASNLTWVPNHSVGIKNVTNMEGMFRGASSFNSPIGNWNTTNVESFYWMFAEATEFNQPIGGWNTKNVKIMSRMFFYGRSFNQPIGDWNTSSVWNMSNMFLGAWSFNQPIGSWDTKNVTNMKRMFKGSRSFNYPLENWNVENVTKMEGMFKNAGSFNQDLSGWCVVNISSTPSGFASGTDDWTLAKPVWGTCP